MVYFRNLSIVIQYHSEIISTPSPHMEGFYFCWFVRGQKGSRERKKEEERNITKANVNYICEKKWMRLGELRALEKSVGEKGN
jgi:hypothetical protein